MIKGDINAAELRRVEQALGRDITENVAAALNVAAAAVVPFVEAAAAAAFNVRPSAVRRRRFRSRAQALPSVLAVEKRWKRGHFSLREQRQLVLDSGSVGWRGLKGRARRVGGVFKVGSGASRGAGQVWRRRGGERLPVDKIVGESFFPEAGLQRRIEARFRREFAVALGRRVPLAKGGNLL